MGNNQARVETKRKQRSSPHEVEIDLSRINILSWKQTSIEKGHWFVGDYEFGWALSRSGNFPHALGSHGRVVLKQSLHHHEGLAVVSETDLLLQPIEPPRRAGALRVHVGNKAAKG